MKCWADKAYQGADGTTRAPFLGLRTKLRQRRTGWTFPVGWSTRESLHVTLVRPRGGRGGRCGRRPRQCRTSAASCPVAPVPPRHLFLRRPGLRGGRLLTAQPRGAPAAATRTAAAAPPTRRGGHFLDGCRICRAAAARPRRARQRARGAGPSRRLRADRA
ncbi:hypothetical protein SGPA1_10606 [Streptomyces misionensis JCM 4497]